MTATDLPRTAPSMAVLGCQSRTNASPIPSFYYPLLHHPSNNTTPRNVPLYLKSHNCPFSTLPQRSPPSLSNPSESQSPNSPISRRNLSPTMSKEFAVPPVVFPTGGGGPGAPNLQQRRVPTAPFQPQPPATVASSAIPFMSFDIGNAASSTTIYSGNLPSSSSVASFDEEEPLLDELGIHPEQIWRKTKSILNPFRVNTSIHHQNSDLSGPILLYLSLCLFQLLSGKIQFGVVLGWIVVSSIFLYVVFNMLAGRNGRLDLHTCTSVIGYCMLPIVVLSALTLFMPQGSLVRFILAGVFVMWATRASTSLMVALADGEEEHRGLIAYACFLIYTLFSLLVVF